MKRFIILIVLVASMGVSTVLAADFTRITGKMETQFPRQSVCLYKVVNGRIDTLATTKLSQEGEFGFLFKADKSTYYLIGEPHKYYRLYLKPGDNASVLFTDSILHFTNKKSNTKENLALYEWEKVFCKLRKMTFFPRIGTGLITYKEMFPELEHVDKQIPQLLNSINTGNKEFDLLMKKSIGYDMDMAALMSVFTPRMAHPKREDYPVQVTRVLNSPLFDSDDILLQPYGSFLLQVAIMYRNLSAERKKANLDLELAMLKGSLTKGEVVVAHASRLKTFKDFTNLMEKCSQYVKDPEQAERIAKIRSRLIVYKEGIPAIDFTYPDENGKMVSLSDFKGKVVVIDVWATWCGPCKKEIPALKEMEKAYHGKNVVFLSVSLDEKKDYEKWKQFIKDNELKGVQLFAEGWSQIAKDYKITGIPRFIVVDKNGNIANVNAPRPSNPELKKLVDSLL